jgi:hypothetical protein
MRLFAFPTEGVEMNSTRRLLVLAGIGLAGLCLSLPIGASTQPTRADAERDPVLKAMLTELDRSKAELQLKDFAKPFFIEYRIEEIDNLEIKAEFGAVNESHRGNGRLARVTVRVGDNKTDSSGGRGDGAIDIVALEDDPIAIRSALWAATDTAYKSALAAYSQTQAALKQVQQADAGHLAGRAAQARDRPGRMGDPRGARHRPLSL